MNEVQEIRHTTGMSQSKFATYFGIPIRTVQKWEIGQCSPAPYVPAMIKRILELEEKNGKIYTV